MSSPEASLTERVKSSFKQLSFAATSLNTRSDQLSKSIARLDGLIQKLSLGVSAWVEFCQRNWEVGTRYQVEEVGYDKVEGRWAIGIRSRVCEEDGAGVDREISSERWLFNDAPRALRLRAVDKVPDLFEQLTREVTSTFRNVDKQLKVLDDFTSAIDAIVAEQSAPFTAPSLHQRLHAALLEIGSQYTADAVENSSIEEADGEVVFATPRAYGLSMKGPDLAKVQVKVLGRPVKIRLTTSDAPTAPNFFAKR